ncbi:MAG TPA: hypothetical protein VN829_07620 [Dongiaceae bacterium]|nr:hypothetical protein [Dongiaceae bacterium]
MNRSLLIGLAAAVCLAALSAAIIQGRQLSDLRTDQRRLVAQFAEPEASGLPAAPQGQGSGGLATAPVSSQLLRLRGEVTRLAALQGELAPARAENERLRRQLAAAGTNSVPGRALPPGYLRRADATLAGYNTPEDTLQSFLWALHHKDDLHVLQAFTPAAAEQLQVKGQPAQVSPVFLDEMEAIIGMAIVNKIPLPDGAVGLSVLVAPDARPLRFALVNVDGQWKIASRPL